MSGPKWSITSSKTCVYFITLVYTTCWLSKSITGINRVLLPKTILSYMNLKVFRYLGALFTLGHRTLQVVKSRFVLHCFSCSHYFSDLNICSMEQKHDFPVHGELMHPVADKYNSRCLSWVKVSYELSGWNLCFKDVRMLFFKVTMLTFSYACTIGGYSFFKINEA